jgi:hypothetical protein
MASGPRRQKRATITPSVCFLASATEGVRNINNMLNIYHGGCA